jgi:3-phosphoshikimate 1-carboxyvinyltransferase
MRLRYNKKKFDATINLPGSKSISNRLLILKEALGLDIRMSNLSEANDTQLLLKAIEKIKAGKKLIDIGDAGTDMRFLTALLCITKGEWMLTGSERMKQRPVGELVNALRSIGAKIEFAEKKGFPPLKISGTDLKGGKIKIKGSISSQFISALLLIAPALKRGLQLQITGKKVSWPYVQMSIDILKEFGIRVTSKKNIITVHSSRKGGLLHDHFEMQVESDWSAASYFYSMMALGPGGQIILKGLNKKSSQGDSVAAKIYRELGVSSVFKDGNMILKKNKGRSSSFKYDFTDCPDLAQTVAVTCFGLNIPCRLSGLSTLKNKETDRIDALKAELEKLGAKVKTTSNSILIKPPSRQEQETRNKKPETGNIRTYSDHRMAMSFASLCLLSDIEIEKPEVVRKSYPSFWTELKKAGIDSK